MKSNKKLGVAIVGLGEYATAQLMPALKETKNCHLAALVSGTRSKLDKYGAEYGITHDHLYTYDNFDDIATDGDVHIVYIVLPNSLHAEFVIRAANAGKHVICEKPMAMNPAECRQMMKAIDHAGVRFSMGHRLFFEPHNQEMMRLGQQEVFGPVRKITLLDSYTIQEYRPWRLDKSRAGGGPLMNFGTYCIQAATYITGRLPIAVTASFAPSTDKERFRDIEEGIKFTLHFENNLSADCECSYTKEQNLMSVRADKGWFQLEPAYEYEGITGISSDGDISFPQVNQQALQMDDFARCIIDNKPTRVPAEMGLRDLEIITAIYKAARNGTREELNLKAFKPMTVVG